MYDTYQCVKCSEEYKIVNDNATPYLCPVCYSGFAGHIQIKNQA